MKEIKVLHVRSRRGKSKEVKQPTDWFLGGGALVEPAVYENISKYELQWILHVKSNSGVILELISPKVDFCIVYSCRECH